MASPSILCLLAREFGSAMSYTEFINAIDAIHGQPHLDEHLFIEAGDWWSTSLDNDLERLPGGFALKNANRHDRRQPGLPARSVSNRGAGSGSCVPRRRSPRSSAC
jgi:hypothetical protein